MSDIWKEFIKGVKPLKSSDNVTFIVRDQSYIVRDQSYSNNRSQQYRLDLHGYTIHEAYKTLMGFVFDHYENESNSIVIITGKSGSIKTEFEYWIESDGIKMYVKKCDPINNGSFRLHLRKK